MPDIGSFITATPKIVELAIDEVVPDPNQPRRHIDEDDLNALAKSIDALGQLVPILVAKDGDRWRIVAGERRWRAMKLLGKPMIAAIDYTYGNQEFIQLAENTARVELTPKEIMDVVDRLTAEGMSAAVIADTLGLSEITIKKYRQILKSPEVAADVRSGEKTVRGALSTIKQKPQGEDAPDIEIVNQTGGITLYPLPPQGVGSLASQSKDIPDTPKVAADVRSGEASVRDALDTVKQDSRRKDIPDTEIVNQTGGETFPPLPPQGVGSLVPQSRDTFDTLADKDEGDSSLGKELSPVRQQIVGYCEMISHDLVHTTNSLALQYMVETLEQIVNSVSENTSG